MPLSTHSLSARYIPAKDNQNGASSTTTATDRSSFCAAWSISEQAIAEGIALPSEDMLQVSPLQEGSELWNWVQPLMSAGGHIIGAPNPTKKSDRSLHKVVEDGLHIMACIQAGEVFESRGPQHAIPVLAGLSVVLKHRANGDLVGLGRRLSNALAPVLDYAEWPQTDAMSSVNEAKDHFVQTRRNFQCREALTVVLDLMKSTEDEPDVPTWKDLKAICGISNSMARWVHRVLASQWPKKVHKWQIAKLRRYCLTPLATGGKNPSIQDYIRQCWRLRPSSISCKLPRRPPPIVNVVLQRLDKEGLGKAQGQEIACHRAQIVAKFQSFQDWILKQHGHNSDPSVWSDTLSRFANAINWSVQEYNKHVAISDSLAHATSFVPRDLAPEMYSSQCHTGYFFLGQGWCYNYSATWRRDAYTFYLQGRLPPEVSKLLDEKVLSEELLKAKVSRELVFQGGHELLLALSEAGISEIVFTDFLRKYYWTGAFLYVNLAPPTSNMDWVVVTR